MNSLNEFHGEQLAGCKIINKENELDDVRKGKEPPALNGGKPKKLSCMRERPALLLQ